MRTLRLTLGIVLVALFVAVPASASSPPGADYHAPPITRTCYADTEDFLSIWRTTFNGVRVDLYCGDRLLVGDDGRCWQKFGAASLSITPCTLP